MGRLLALLALVLVVPGTEASARHDLAGRAAARPDLVVVRAKLTSRPYVFTDGSVRLAFVDVTRNAGGVSAPASHTGLRVISPRNRSVVAIRAVPALRPGGQDQRHHAESHATSFPGAELGAHKVLICADDYEQIAESNESNNCISAGNFYVAKRTWAGNVIGSLSYTTAGSAREYWQQDSGLAKFTFAGYKSGKFGYLFHGNVDFHEDGDDGLGCMPMGEGHVSSGQPGAGAPWASLTLDYLHNRYTGYGYVGNPKPPIYEIRWSCDPPSVIPLPGPIEHTFFYVNYPAVRRLPFNTRVLDGDTRSGNSGYPTEWHWHLR